MNHYSLIWKKTPFFHLKKTHHSLFSFHSKQQIIHIRMPIMQVVKSHREWKFLEKDQQQKCVGLVMWWYFIPDVILCLITCTKFPLEKHFMFFFEWFSKSVHVRVSLLWLWSGFKFSLFSSHEYIFGVY